MSRPNFSQFFEQTKLTKTQLNRLNKAIHIHLNYPENQVGREGRGKHDEAWDIWLDGFIDPVIDAAELGGRVAFWNAGSKPTIQKLVRIMVRNAANSIRNHLGKGTLPDWMIATTYPPREKGTYTGPRGLGSGSKSSRADSGTDSSGSERSGNEKENTYNSLPPQPSGRSAGPHPLPTKKRRKTDPTTPFDKYAPTASTASSSSVLNQPVTFLTRLQIPNTDVVRHEFVDTVGIVTLADFLQMLRESNGMLPGQYISSFEVEIGGRTVDVEVDDPESDWEWGLVLGILHFSGVPDGQRAYVDIKVNG